MSRKKKSSKIYKLKSLKNKKKIGWEKLRKKHSEKK